MRPRTAAFSAGLIEHLADPHLPAGHHPPAEQVLCHTLVPTGIRTVDGARPTDPRAARIATALATDPADGRSLAEWGHLVGASVRTLTRVFADNVGMSFARDRTRIRLHAAFELLLADGLPVTTVARRVGYRSPSAFRRTTGIAPGRHLAHTWE